MTTILRNTNPDIPDIWRARVPRDIAEQIRHEGGRDSPSLHPHSIKRQLDPEAPEYRP